MGSEYLTVLNFFGFNFVVQKIRGTSVDSHKILMIKKIDWLNLSRLLATQK